MWTLSYEATATEDTLSMTLLLCSLLNFLWSTFNMFSSISVTVQYMKFKKTRQKNSQSSYRPFRYRDIREQSILRPKYYDISYPLNTVNTIYNENFVHPDTDKSNFHDMVPKKNIPQSKAANTETIEMVTFRGNVTETQEVKVHKDSEIGIMAVAEVHEDSSVTKRVSVPAEGVAKTVPIPVKTGQDKDPVNTEVQALKPPHGAVRYQKLPPVVTLPESLTYDSKEDVSQIPDTQLDSDTIHQVLEPEEDTEEEFQDAQGT